MTVRFGSIRQGFFYPVFLGVNGIDGRTHTSGVSQSCHRHTNTHILRKAAAWRALIDR